MSIEVDMRNPGGDSRLISVIAGPTKTGDSWASTKFVDHPALVHQFATHPAVESLHIPLVGVLELINEHGITHFDLKSGFSDQSVHRTLRSALSRQHGVPGHARMGARGHRGG